MYRPTGNTIVFNSMRIPGKDYQMKVKKITEYEEGKYKLTVEAYLTNVGSSVKEYRKNTRCIWKKTTAPNLGLLSAKLNYKKST